MFVLTLPLLLLGQFLVFFSSRILGADHSTTFLACVVIFTLTFAIVALGTGMGAIFPRFEVENPAHIPTGIGGIFYMIASLGLIGATLLLLARPVHILLISRIREVSPTTGQWAEIAAIYALIAGFHYLVVHLSMNRGCRALNAMEL
jgi:ABC-2 type transport system permease protein